MSRYERNEVIRLNPNAEKFIRKFAGGEEILYGKDRYCLWIEDSDLDAALSIPYIYGRIQDVKNQRSESSDEGGRKLAEKAHQFRDRNYSLNHTIAFARTSSENRYYLPIILLSQIGYFLMVLLHFMMLRFSILLSCHLVAPDMDCCHLRTA